MDATAPPAGMGLGERCPACGSEDVLFQRPPLNRVCVSCFREWATEDRHE